MGGSSYDRDVYSSGGSRSSSGFHMSDQAQRSINRSGINHLVLPKKHLAMSCPAETGVVVGLDGTGSMGDAAFVLYDKLPMFWGQIEQQGYLRDFALSFAVVGDVNTDRAPLQVSPFSQGKEIDKWIKRLFIEQGGGGQDMESYEALAYFYARHVNFPHPQAAKPFFFMIGDESYYDQVPGEAIFDLIGERPDSGLSAEEIFQELMERYHVYMLHVYYSHREDWVCRRWKKILGQNFVQLEEPKAVVDVVLGIIALMAQTRDLDGYLSDMENRGQTTARIAHVRSALTEVSTALVRTDVKLPAMPPAKRRGGRSKRL